MDASFIRAIRVRSNYGPDVDLDLRTPPNPETAALMKKLQPQIILDTDFGPFNVAPYGNPGPSAWNSLLAGGGVASALVFALAGYGAFKFLTR